MIKNSLSLIFLILCYPAIHAQVLIPAPEQLRPAPGKFVLKSAVPVVYAADTSAAYLRLFQSDVLQSRPLERTCENKKASVRFITDTTCPEEAYKLIITPKGIEIRAAASSGFFYAVQTLKQWVDVSGKHPVFACVTISDRPRIRWRSFMLDSGRQYQQVPTIKKYIDMAASLKMNYFHWHLTEGLGWRIEIKRYPELTRTGAYVGKGAEQQGFYTQEEIREIVAYASERNVTVVPEIDMPGHAEAALSAYPELSCFGTAPEIPERGFTPTIFCAGKDSTLQFLKQVLDEVCDLFPSAYIHLGGDEAPKGNWDRCPDCRQRIRTEQLKDSHDLQLWFSARMAEYLKEKGRRAIFWGDVVYRPGYPLPDNVVIHWWNWRGHRTLAFDNALKSRYPVICGTNYYTYLNFPVTPWKGYAPDRTFDLKDVFLHNPSYRPEANDPLILGMSCALWSDDGVTEAMIDRRLFPRILALAEQMWHCGEAGSFDAFYERVRQKQSWFAGQGFGFGPALKEETDVHYKWD